MKFKSNEGHWSTEGDGGEVCGGFQATFSDEKVYVVAAA